MIHYINLGLLYALALLHHPSVVSTMRVMRISSEKLKDRSDAYNLFAGTVTTAIVVIGWPVFVIRHVVIGFWK